MHRVRIVTFYEIGNPAAALEEMLQFLMFDPGKNCGIADLVAVQVQDRQHSAVRGGVEKFV